MVEARSVPGSFVSNTERLLHPARGDNEFNELFAHMDRGSASLNIGVPIDWRAIRANNSPYEGNKHEWNQRVCNTLLALVARLGPKEQAGCHNPDDPATWSLIAPLLDGGTL